MILTDTLYHFRTAFDKIVINIVGPLTPTKTGHDYIVTVQDLLRSIKFLVAILTE